MKIFDENIFDILESNNRNIFKRNKSEIIKSKTIFTFPN